jgi:redox-sensitive bicupin YhaK (pirin superfamily)
VRPLVYNPAMRSNLVSRRQIVLAAAAGVPATALGACSGARPTSPVAVAARDVRLVVEAQRTADGAGVRLRRALGTRALPMLDPFLLLDEMHSDRPEDYLAGFPTHPHRGFETVTYVLEGAVDHKDSLGNHGHLGPGSIQWMTAGHGIVHSEMPNHETGNSRLWGFQLWVNLPASRKMMKPRYQDLAPDRVPEAMVQDARIRVVAGEAGGVRGPVEGIVTSPTMLDIAIARKGRAVTPLPDGHNALLYVIDGSAEFGPSATTVREGQVAVLAERGDLSVRSGDGVRFLLFAGQPLGEPVARSGPFVMNTEDELRRAWEDYRSGTLVDAG